MSIYSFDYGYDPQSEALPHSYDPSAEEDTYDLTDEEIEQQYKEWEEEQTMRHLRGDAYPCTVLSDMPLFVPPF